MIYVGSQVIFFIHMKKKWYCTFVGPQMAFFIHIGEKKRLKKKHTHTHHQKKPPLKPKIHPKSLFWN